MTETNNIQPIYTPTDILNITKEHIRTANILVVVEGVYSKCGRREYNGVWYESLKSQYDVHKLTIIIPTPIRDQVNDGELIQVSGTMEKKLNDDGLVSLQLRVSGLVGKKEKEIDEAEIQALEIQQTKSSLGYKNVDNLIEAILYEGIRKPKISLLFAESSITDADFKAGIQAASGSIDFIPSGTTFTRIPEFIHKLQLLDSGGFDLICIVRGGGNGIEEVFGNVELARAILGLNTPILSAIGHQVDNPLVCKIADKNIGTPSLMGQYFKDMVERISGEKTNSKAVLVEQVKKQFADQIEAQGKQINALQKQITEQSDKYTKELSESKVEVEKMKGKVREVEEIGRRKRNGLVAAVIVLGVLLVAAVVFILLNMM